MNATTLRLIQHRLIGVVFVVAASLLAGCATMGGGSLKDRSARLEDQSREFYSEVRSQARERTAGAEKQVTPVSQAAEALIISSRDLNRAVERRATNQQVLSEFDRVARDYKQLEDSLKEEGHGGRDEKQAAQFERVSEAYKAVQDSLSPKQAEAQRISMTPTQEHSVTEIERRMRLKEYWFD